MQNAFLGRVAPGMTVFDIGGHKIGDIARVYRFPVAVGTTAGSGSQAVVQDDVIEVKTGLFGLGQHYYIPTSAIDDGLEESVFLSQPKEELDRLGWNVKPKALEGPE